MLRFTIIPNNPILIGFWNFFHFLIANKSRCKLNLRRKEISIIPQTTILHKKMIRLSLLNSNFFLCIEKKNGKIHWKVERYFVYNYYYCCGINAIRIMIFVLILDQKRFVFLLSRRKKAKILFIFKEIMIFTLSIYEIA